MIPRKFEPMLFGLILSGFMSLVVSGLSTMHAAGAIPHFMQLWMGAWMRAWAFTFPLVLLVAPLARRLVQMVLVRG